MGTKTQKNFVMRVFTVVIGMLMVSMLWQLLPIKNPLTDSMRTAVFCALHFRVTFCFHVNFMESAFIIPQLQLHSIYALRQQARLLCFLQETE